MSPAGGNLQSDNRKGRDLTVPSFKLPFASLKFSELPAFGECQRGRLAFFTTGLFRMNNLEDG